MTIAVSAPSRVRARLRGAPDGPVPVVHRGRDAVYVDVAGRCVGVVGRRATAVPCALRTTCERLDGPDGLAPTTAHLADGVLHLDGVPLVVGRIVDVRVPRVPGLAPIRGSHVPDVRAMVGRGEGLTPYDDDVLCGWLAVHRAAGVSTPEVDGAVRECLTRTTLLSATLLDCALHGEVVPEFAAFVAALGTPAETAAAAALSAVGHTSGAGLLAGARLALADLRPVRGAA